MIESITTFVNNPDEKNVVLRLEVDEEFSVFKIYLDDKLVCSGDWQDNLLGVLERAIELWGTRKEVLTA